MTLFAASIFLSAFLLFLVQPLIAKAILPWFGGSAAVWTTCLMFFQTALLAGYAYAHASVRFLKPRTQAALHAVLLLASLFTLPILPGPGLKPSDAFDPASRITILLMISVGLPYLLLSANGPLLQAWLVRQRPGATPYRLYALSNAGSLLALAAFPALIEPYTRLRPQGYGWSIGYAVFAALSAGIALKVYRSSPPPAVARATESSAMGPPWTRRLWWAAFAFCPSALLAAVTSHMTQNVAPVPLLWVAPLGLYLISFIVTFESDRWYGRPVWFPLFIFAVALMLAFLFPGALQAGPKWEIPVFVTGFFICAVVCHGELYRLRPEPRWLTSFYLMIATGGALGGVFVAVIAPVVFSDMIELPVALAATVILVGSVLHKGRRALPGPAARYVEYALVTALAGGFLYLLLWQHPRWAASFKVMRRNFYAAVRVSDTTETEETEPMRELTHGVIIHGSEYLRAPFHRRPTTYYGPASGIGIALDPERAAPPRSVGVIGLGTGTISGYARPGDSYRFYEINPMILDIARTWFFYLKECPARWGVSLGDARLSLERETGERFDVLAVDAFSGDSIPVHLLTIEAFRGYLRHLADDGIVAVHTSNKFLELNKIVARAAASLGKGAALISSPDDDYTGSYKADWVIVANDARTLARPEWKIPQRIPLPPPGDLWTDDYSNLLRALK